MLGLALSRSTIELSVVAARNIFKTIFKSRNQSLFLKIGKILIKFSKNKKWHSQSNLSLSVDYAYKSISIRV